MSRVLITGLATYWGGRLAQILESDPGVELVVGVDRHDPNVELTRTEFVRIKEQYGALRRIVESADIDTILHTDLIVDSTKAHGRAIHENNVIGTMNLLAAAAATNSPVRKVVVKSSGLVYGGSKLDPQIFRENNQRTSRPQTRVERSLLEVEDYVRDFAQDNPHVSVTLLRFANVVGAELDTPLLNMLRMRLIPAIAGFDPMIQVVHVDDAASALAFALQNNLNGVYNVAADGMLPWSEIRAMTGKPALCLPPIGTEASATVLRTARIIDLPPELLTLLRFGHGLDNQLFKSTGFRFRYTTDAAINDFVNGMRLENVIGTSKPVYEYQDDVEQFIHRHSQRTV